MLDKLSIEINNPHSFKKSGELFQIGIPFPISALNNPDSLVLLAQSTSQSIPFSYQVSLRWPDASVKWLLLTCCLDLDAGQTITLGLKKAGIDYKPSVPADIPYKTDWNAQHLSLPDIQAKQGQHLLPLTSALVLLDAHGNSLQQSITDHSRDTVSGPMPLDLVKQSGHFSDAGNSTELDFISTQEWLPASGLLKWQLTLWNKRAAKHPGGCWDLGDPGSVLFKAMSLTIKPKTEFKVLWRSQAENDFEQVSKHFSVQQSGSACKVADPDHPAFNRNIHKNAQGEVPTWFNGCEIRRNGSTEQLALRASPEVFISGDEANSADEKSLGLALSLAGFWQNFPKAIRVQDQEIQLCLFPDQDEAYELQAGERKTHTLYFALTDAPHALAWVNAPSDWKLSHEWLRSCGYLSQSSQSLDMDALLPFIQQGIDGPESFLAKRERIDEYGWRHFGDVYADHECLYQKPGEKAYVSHYNNQYDAIYGYANQYLLSGDPRWFQLMDELARHVCDIDIYHTDQDRVEYNNGLFWHTDHYLDAHTCTHRTFTRHNQTSSTPGQTGGGPGTEHCYTTGLRLHFLLTGYEPSKEAAVKLADWMIATHAGARSFLAQVLSAKNHELKKLLAVLKGQAVSPYRYPFTRGTGNFMAALMDAYELTQKQDYLTQLEKVIRESIHPADDIAQRNLHDIELAWSYTVYLQALSRYLNFKENLQQNDEMYAYARASLLHYSRWMLENESPYLSKPDVLEFPNDTWVAQEIRKLSVMVSAAQYDTARKPAYLLKAREFLTYIVNKLESSPEKHFSRIQILLLQSYGPHLYCQEGGPDLPEKNIQPIRVNFGNVPTITATKLLMATIKKVFIGIRFFSPANERLWIKTRRS